MYLRTPKRYQKQQRHLMSLRWLWLWILTPIVVLAGWMIYERRDEFAPPVQRFVASVADSARSGVSTMVAPTPMPTEDPTRRLTLANNAWQQGSIDDALREYEVILPSLPNDVQSHYRYAFGLLMEGRNQEALAAAEAAITANPFSPDAWAIRSQALNANGRQGEAIASALQALQLQPNSARATAFLAEAYFDSNQVERALTTVEKALQMDPNSFEALYVYGRIQDVSIYDFPAAMEAFQQAYSIAPNMPYIGVQMAWLQYKLEDVEAGFDTLQRIVDLNPRNGNALYALAFFSYSYFGDGNQALDYLSRCVENNPRNLVCMYYMARVYYFMGEYERAKNAFMRVIDTGTTNPQHYLSAGRINSQLNNCGAAVPLLRQGYELEQSRTVPDSNRLNEFEEALGGCGAFASRAPIAEMTPEATPALLEE